MIDQHVTSNEQFPFYGHNEGLVISGPDERFAQRPMTPAELAARQPALSIAKDIYRHANQAGVCYAELWALIAMAMQKLLDEVTTHEPRLLPEVAGDSLPTTLAQFEHRAKFYLGEEQQKPNPDNALIALLCDAVRLARENERMGKAGIALPPGDDVPRRVAELYDAALCSITFNLNEPVSAKEAERALDAAKEIK